LPYGYRSHHGIDLDTHDSIFPPPEPVPEPAQLQQQQQPKTYAQAANGKATPMPKQTSLQKAVQDAKNREGQLQQHGAQHGKPPAANQLAKHQGSNSDALSISTFNGSNDKITPPGSPKAPTKPKLLLTNGANDGFVDPASNKKKRGRNAIDFSNMLKKQSVQPLNGIATSNYFQTLQTMEVKFESKNLTADKQYGVRHQVLPVDVNRPDE
jgi:hypothetical protein